jgi:putative membrane protein
LYGTAVLALSAAPLVAQQPGSQAPGGGPQGASRSQSPSAALGSADRQFIMEAAHGGLAEVELGRMASTKAQSPQVKQFAQKMIDDHGKANQELKTLAQNKSVTIPTELDAKHKATKDRLEKLSGAEFDRAYMQEMVADHQKTVSDFRKQSQSGQDPDVKAWAAKSLPILEQHYQMAQQTSRGAVGTSGSQPAPGGSGATGTRGTTGGQTPRGGSDDASGGANTGRPR